MTILRDLSPLHNNLLATQGMLLYVKIAVEVMGWLRKKQPPNSRAYTKQLLHCCVSSTVVFWPLFDRSHWSWRLNAIVPTALAARCVYKGAIVKDPSDMEVQTMTRSSSPTELLFGPWLFCCIMVWLGLNHFMEAEAAVLASALGIGDGLLAPVIGDLYGRHVYQLPVQSNKKTMEGSVVGVFLGTCLASYLYLYLMGISLLPLRIILVYGGIAAVAEGTAPDGLDNLAITVALHFSMDRIHQWLPV